MFEPGATMVNVSIRKAVPMPTSPMVLPVDAMPAPTAASGNRLDRRQGARLKSGWLWRERGRLCRCRQGHAERKRQDQRAYLCLHNERLTRFTGAMTNETRTAAPMPESWYAKRSVKDNSD